MFTHFQKQLLFTDDEHNLKCKNYDIIEKRDDEKKDGYNCNNERNDYYIKLLPNSWKKNFFKATRTCTKP